MPVIIFNGRKYNSLEEMPANEREAYENINDIFADKDGNGIPDVFEREVVEDFIQRSGGVVTYKGGTFSTFEEMPPELRQKMQDAFAVMKKMGLVPDSLPATASRAPTPVQPSKLPIDAAPSIIEEDRKGGNTFIGIMIGILLCFGIFVAGFAVLYFMQR